MKASLIPGRVVRLLCLLAVVVGLVLGGCPLMGTEDFYFSNTPKQPITVSNYNLYAYVPIPVEGASPVTAVEGRLDLEVSVVWMDESGNDITGTLDAFVRNAIYRAKITLTSKTGYTFDPGTSFQYYPPDAVETQSTDNSPRVREISISYKRTTVPIPEKDLYLTYKVFAPVTGAMPVTEFFVPLLEPYLYRGSVEWSNDGGTHSGPFVAQTEYTAAITLTVEPGWTFAGVENVIHARASGLVGKPSNTGNTIKVTFLFPPANDSLPDPGMGFGWEE
jgi:hypothetical protein